jgi:hypothetical protein
VNDHHKYKSDDPYYEFPVAEELLVLLDAKDEKSIPLVEQLLTHPPFSAVRDMIISSLADNVSHFEENYGRLLNHEVDKSDFLTSHHAIYKKLFLACGVDASESLILLVMTGAKKDEVRQLVSKGLVCDSLEVKATAAHVAAFFELADQVSTIQQGAVAWPEGAYPWSRNLLCKSLNELSGQKCPQ